MTHLPDPRHISAEQHAALYELARRRAAEARHDVQQAFWAGMAKAVCAALKRTPPTPAASSCLKEAH